jgi:uncharacterized membrane protein YesL
MMPPLPDETRPPSHSLKEIFLDAYYDSIPLITLNLAWLLLSLPLVTAFPAAAGLYYATNQLAHQKSAGWETFIDGFRRYFWIGWRWGLLNLGALALLGVNIAFYAGLDAAWAPLLQGVFVSLSILWLLLQLYTFPLLLEQETPRLRTALYNSLVILARSPLPSLGLAALLIAICLLSTLLFFLWFVLTVSLSAYLCNRATLRAIQKIKSRQT